MVNDAKLTVGGLVAVLDANRPRLLAFARRCGAGDDAEDVLQEVWIRVQATRQPVREPLSYLHRAVYNVILDHRRGTLRARNRDTAWHAERAPIADSPLVMMPEAEQAMLAREALAAAQARLDALGEPTRSIFLRHRLRGDPQKMIARELGMGLSTVEKHLRRAYRALLELREGDADA